MLFLHVGDHFGRTLRELAAHIVEPDHLVFAAVAIAFGLWACRRGPRADARVEARVRIKRDRRS